MPETTKHRVEIFFTVDGFYHVYSDPGIEVFFGHERLSEYVLYKGNPIEEGFLDGQTILLPPESPDELDPVNKLVLELA